MTISGAGFVDDDNIETVLRSHPIPRRALFLDRDGVINVDHPYVHTPEETDWLHGVFDLCAVAIEVGFVLVVVTNQAGIARGLYTEDEFIAYTRWVHRQFRERGIPLMATGYCPHHPEFGLGPYLQSCNCRKPAPGMILDAAERYGIIIRESWLVGNRQSDIAAGAAAGVGRRILLDDAGNAGFDERGATRVRSLDEARRIIGSTVHE